MTEKTYSLEEAAQIIRGSAKKSDRDWLMLRLRSGRLPGFKAGNRWRMTQADVEASIELLRPRVVVPDVPSRGLTRTSARRLAS